MTPEGRVKKLVKSALDKLGADCWRFMPVQTGFGSPALDYLLCIKGVFVSIETKAPGKKLTPLQEGTKAAIEAAGGIVLVVWDEGSLAIAMKIILAMEFDSGHQQVLGAVADWGNSASPAQTQEYHQQHLREQHAAQAPDAATGRDHGAPGATPQRRAKPDARGDNSRITAAVTDTSGTFPCESGEFNGPYCKTPCGKC